MDYQNFRGTYCTISHANFLEYDAIQISRIIISVNIYTVEQIGFKLKTSSFKFKTNLFNSIKDRKTKKLQIISTFADAILFKCKLRAGNQGLRNGKNKLFLKHNVHKKCSLLNCYYNKCLCFSKSNFAKD